MIATSSDTATTRTADATVAFRALNVGLLRLTGRERPNA